MIDLGGDTTGNGDPLTSSSVVALSAGRWSYSGNLLLGEPNLALGHHPFVTINATANTVLRVAP
jgi:hypothetical protein